MSCVDAWSAVAIAQAARAWTIAPAKVSLNAAWSVNTFHQVRQSGEPDLHSRSVGADSALRCAYMNNRDSYRNFGLPHPPWSR
jgi:hypothetical protein